ncbi:hypothetical protein [Ruminococcus flavefaciens]|uniref:hypothetical protein n=1 Tax=Ruminococcus flavefaciens TaxID=1265 RepID=UPI001563EAA3|nr:hypothetical protein [Ruminococcus flavefaciens]
MNAKNMKKMPRKRSPLMTAAKAVMLVLSLVFSCAMPVLAGSGLLYNRESYGDDMAKTGIFMIISAILMTVGAVLCLFRKNLPNILSAVLSVGGLILCLAMLKILTDHADASGWTDKYTLSPVSGMYTARILPCIIPAVMAAVIAAVQLCSYDLREQRRARKARKLAEKNAPAPPIV